MPRCSICLEPFAVPVSLPCGQSISAPAPPVLNSEQAMSSAASAFASPSMPPRRIPHNTPAIAQRAADRLASLMRAAVTIDPAVVPPYLRPHVLPPFRPVFFDDLSPASSPDASSSASPSPCAPTPDDLRRAHAEISALRTSCATWRRRAEVHAAGNAGLLGLARATKDCALRLRAERDAARARCTALKRALAESPDYAPRPAADVPLLLRSDAADAAADRAHAHARVARGAGHGLPVYLMQARPAAHFYDDPRDMEASHFGPPMKRRKASASPACEPGGAVPAPVAAAPTPGAAPLGAPLNTPEPAGAVSDAAASSRRPRSMDLGLLADVFP
ncbi:hypothetical protein GGX14DRAFT_662140 [Mycena pura]|uniref:Uncharacterized protein n=1 Tax=Mycena pura TaxID=153505 RepID=A0AAD6Y6F2_9AGAR|nr:hypothetical protein GGX14DRAFT_662140 [Mycena pura]